MLWNVLSLNSPKHSFTVQNKPENFGTVQHIGAHVIGLHSLCSNYLLVSLRRAARNRYCPKSLQYARAASGQLITFFNVILSALIRYEFGQRLTSGSFSNVF